MAVLLAGLVSVTPAGAVTVAVLLIVPVADGLIWAIAVKVTVPLGNRSTVVAILPVPPGWATLDPAEATAVQLAVVMADGKRSETSAP